MSVVTLEEAKTYLRINDNDEDDLITSIIDSAEQLITDVCRLPKEDIEGDAEVRIAILYTIAYIFEHREEADHHELTMTLRSLLFGIREAKF